LVYFCPMRDYELTFIVSAKLAEKDRKTVLDNVVKWVGGGKKGEVEKEEDWGVKKLAYPIEKETEGQYFCWQVKIDPSVLAVLKQKMNLDENIIRYLLIRKD